MEIFSSFFFLIVNKSLTLTVTQQNGMPNKKKEGRRKIENQDSPYHKYGPTYQ